jgi:hypothetical protein
LLIGRSYTSPQNNESAGKKKNVRISRAGVYIKPLLVQCANAATKYNSTKITDQFYRVKSLQQWVLANAKLDTYFCGPVLRIKNVLTSTIVIKLSKSAVVTRDLFLP